VRAVFLGGELLLVNSVQLDRLKASSEASMSKREPDELFDMFVVVSLLYSSRKEWHRGRSPQSEPFPAI